MYMNIGQVKFQYTITCFTAFHMTIFSVLWKIEVLDANYRCQLWEKDTEIREMKDQIKELVGLLRQSEIKRKEAEKELRVREQAIVTTLATPISVRSYLPKIHAKNN